MYDIANVLKSLGVIEKQKNTLNKNVFKWIGSAGFSLEKKKLNVFTTVSVGVRHKRVYQKHSIPSGQLPKILENLNYKRMCGLMAQ